jgi:hypothetical protein
MRLKKKLQRRKHRKMQVNGVNYEVDWTKFKVGRSFFVPCLDAEEARTAVKNTMNRLGFKVKVKLVVEDGFRGLRIWRVG